MRGPEPQVVVRPRSAAELAATLDGIERIFSEGDRAEFERASLAAEQVLVAYELALSARTSELTAAVALLDATRGQELCGYIVGVRAAVESAAGPVRELYDVIGTASDAAVKVLAMCAVDELRDLVAMAEAAP